MKVLIVDDEPPARDRLKRQLAELQDWSVIAEAGNGKEAIELCESHGPDVVLMDIRMPGMDGVEAARHLSGLKHPPAVIFTTAYDQYAVEAFETHAVGYLLKPVRKERLLQALARSARLTRPQLQAINVGEEGPRPRQHVCARIKGELRLVPVADIIYFQAEQKYVTVRHKQGELLIEEPLKQLAEEFRRDFARIHRNALIAVAQLESLERDEDGKHYARMRGCDARLAVSRRHAAEVKRRLRATTAEDRG